MYSEFLSVLQKISSEFIIKIKNFGKLSRKEHKFDK